MIKKLQLRQKFSAALNRSAISMNSQLAVLATSRIFCQSRKMKTAPKTIKTARIKTTMSFCLRLIKFLPSKIFVSLRARPCYHPSFYSGKCGVGESCVQYKGVSCRQPHFLYNHIKILITKSKNREKKRYGNVTKSQTRQKCRMVICP